MSAPANIEVVASVARAVAAAEQPQQALHAVLAALRTELRASGVALLRVERLRLVPIHSLGMRITQRQLEEAGLDQEAIFPLVLGGRVEGALIVRGVERDELADAESRVAPLLELAAAALRNARLAEQHDRLAAIMSSADDAVIGTQLDGTVTTWNPGAERLYGYTAAQIVGQSASILVPGDGTARLRDLLKRVQQGEHIQHFETVLLSRAGDPVDVSLSVAAVERTPGDVVGVAFVAREIAAWKRALQAQQLLAHASAALTSTLDYEATLHGVPRAFVPALAGYCVFDLLEPNAAPRSLSFADGNAGREAILRMFLQERASNLEASEPFASVIRTGEVVLVPHVTDAWLASLNRTPQELALITHLEVHSLVIAPVRAGQRTIGLLTLAATDTHRAYDSMDVPLVQELAHRTALAVENARLYREAQQAVEVRDQVLSSVSHDLRSPLTAILTEASLLNRTARDIDDHGPQIARGSQLIESSVKRMNGWIDDLLDVAQLDAGAELHLNLAPVDLAALVREAAADQQQATRRHTTIRVDVVKTLSARLDGSRLRRVLDNLLGNAVKYTPAGGSVEVSLVSEDFDGRPSALLTVRDNGIGIPADDLPRIFERYHRASNVGKIHGSGLGLAGARQIVEQHGGTLLVDSTEGRGTVVRVRLPLDPA